MIYSTFPDRRRLYPEEEMNFLRFQETHVDSERMSAGSEKKSDVRTFLLNKLFRRQT